MSSLSLYSKISCSETLPKEIVWIFTLIGMSTFSVSGTTVFNSFVVSSPFSIFWPISAFSRLSTVFLSLCSWISPSVFIFSSMLEVWGRMLFIFSSFLIRSLISKLVCKTFSSSMSAFLEFSIFSKIQWSCIISSSLSRLSPKQAFSEFSILSKVTSSCVISSRLIFVSILMLFCSISSSKCASEFWNSSWLVMTSSLSWSWSLTTWQISVSSLLTTWQFSISSPLATWQILVPSLVRTLEEDWECVSSLVSSHSSLVSVLLFCASDLITPETTSLKCEFSSLSALSVNISVDFSSLSSFTLVSCSCSSQLSDLSFTPCWIESVLSLFWRSMLLLNDSSLITFVGPVNSLSSSLDTDWSISMKFSSFEVFVSECFVEQFTPL